MRHRNLLKVAILVNLDVEAETRQVASARRLNQNFRSTTPLESLCVTRRRRRIAGRRLIESTVKAASRPCGDEPKRGVIVDVSNAMSGEKIAANKLQAARALIKRRPPKLARSPPMPRNDDDSRRQTRNRRFGRHLQALVLGIGSSYRKRRRNNACKWLYTILTPEIFCRHSPLVARC